MRDESLVGYNTTFWPVFDNEAKIGSVTAAIHSPRLDQNIALVMVNVEFAEIATQLRVKMPNGTELATVVDNLFMILRRRLQWLLLESNL